MSFSSSEAGSPACSSPALSNGSMSSFESSQSRVRLQDRAINHGKAMMMRDYVPTHINIMLYGESGLGKTTCIRNLIGSWPVQSMGEAFRNSGKTSLELFRQDSKNLQIKLEPIRSEEANRDLLVTFQDMPGWGDELNLVNSLKTVVAFLLRQRQADFHAQDGGFPVNGAASHRGCLQNAITVCLYFVPPHRVKPIDWIMMAAINKLVAVVPIISKADTHTPQEMEAFRAEMLQVIQSAASKAVEAPLAPGGRTSGCGAATPQGIRSTVTANTKRPMTPREAAALSAAARKGSSAASPVAAKAEPAATVPAQPAAAPGSGSSPDKKAAAAGKAAAAAPSSSADKTPAETAASGPAADLLASVRAVSRSVVLPESELGACMVLAGDLSLQTYTFSSEALEAIDATTSLLPPFAVVSSPDLLPADAPEVSGICCNGDTSSSLPRDYRPSAGEPVRRYAWGAAFPLNRAHSDLIILKQLLTGHCNTAIYDLLDDSWRRACRFAESYRLVLVQRGGDIKGDMVGASGLLDSLVDEVCACGKTMPIQDRLRDDEQKQLRADYERASSRLRELEETVATQRRALGSLQQQLTSVLKNKRSGLKKLLGMTA